MRPNLINSIADRTIVGGMVGFTKLGYLARRRGWEPLNPNLDGRTVVITGATSGLGRAAAQRLATFGPRLVLVGRNPEKLQSTIEEIAATTGNENLRAAVADLSLMSSVRNVADELLDSESEIHCLINNAGALFGERSETTEGIELTLATNLLSHFLLTNLLLERIKESAPARIVNVSSGGMYTQGISLSNLQWEHGEYEGAKAYARTKRGQVILTEMWAEMLADTAVTVNSMHPGWANTPGLGAIPVFRKIVGPILRSADEGADTVVWLAASPEVTAVSGKFFLDRQPHLTKVLPSTDLNREDRVELWNQLAALSAWDGPPPGA
jgi:NAD(P)-dependent dehydrogenase (short-subunit alcohol dehydrogenase family)